MKRLLPLLLWLFPVWLQAAPALTAFEVTTDGNGDETWSVSLQILVLMTALTFLPAALMMMTSFTRIVIVLAILRQGLGTMQTPSNQILIGLALMLSFFIMAPVFHEAWTQGVSPYLEEKLSAEEALERAARPFREFMIHQTRETDIALFAELGDYEGRLESPEDVPFRLLLPAFVTSELKTAFQIGFLILIPFLVIDLVIASLLMSMGMMMLSPMIISLPFKIMLFVLIDGWPLLMGTLASSFYI